MEEDRDKPWNFHTCKLCSYRSKSTFVMCEHIRLHRTRSKTDIFFCDSNTPELFECEICNSHFDLKMDLTEHFRVFHEDKEVNEEMEDILKCHDCKNCDFQTYSVLVLTKHVVSCNSMFKKNSSEVRGATHEQNKHFSTGNWFECIQCEFKTKRRGHLQRHIIAKHTNPEDINWFRCDRCEFKTKRNDHLKQHVVHKHTNPEDINWFRCVHCGFKAERNSNLNQHITAKHFSGTKAQNTNWFICYQCRYETRRKQDLKRHIIVKHTHADDINWFKCKHCEYKTNQKYNLKEHVMFKHTKPEDINWFTCVQCGYKAKKKSLLKQHILRRH